MAEVGEDGRVVELLPGGVVELLPGVPRPLLDHVAVHEIVRELLIDRARAERVRAERLPLLRVLLEQLGVGLAERLEVGQDGLPPRTGLVREMPWLLSAAMRGALASARRVAGSRGSRRTWQEFPSPPAGKPRLSPGLFRLE